MSANDGGAAFPRKLKDSAFKPNHCAESNRVFLWEACEEPPHMRAVSGWKIVGYGRAPWSKPDYPMAVMFERTEPPSNVYGNTHGDEMEEGTRIWQHGKEEWIPGTETYRKWAHYLAEDAARQSNPARKEKI